MKLSELTLIAAFASITYGSYVNQSLESDTLRTPIEHATGDATQVVDLPTIAAALPPDIQEYTAGAFDWTVVANYEIYCPEPTTIITNDNTYVATEATTLTITDCPCTVPVVTPPAPSIVVPSSSAVPPTLNVSSTTAVKPSTSVVSSPSEPPVPYPAPHENTTTEISWEVVTEFTTYCPEPTTIITNDYTYVVTEATTLTITDCPCTVPVVTPPAPSIVVPSSSAVPPTFNVSSTTAVKPSTSVVSSPSEPPVPYPAPHENTTTEISWEVVTEFTTYCPEPTTIITNDNTYVVTEATTLTISDCPCTVPVVTPPAPSVIKPSTAVSSPPPAPPTPPTDTPLTPSTSSATVTLTPSIPSVKPSTTAASSPSSAPPASPSAQTTTLVTSSNPPPSTTFEIQSVAGGSKLNVGFAGLVAIIAHFVQL